MTISHINGIALTGLSHINGIVKANVSAKNGQTLAAGTEGVPAPTLTGTPTLLASWDFDAASTITLSGSDIDQISGADGTSYTLLTPGNMPAQNTVSGKKTAQFVTASSEYMQIASDCGVGAAGCTQVIIGFLNSTATQVFLDIANGASGAAVNRQMSYHAAATGFTTRKCDAGSQEASVGATASTGLFIVVNRYPTGTANAKLNENGRGTVRNSAGTNGLPSGISHTTLGARRESNLQSLYAAFDCFRVLVYAGDIGDTATEELATWATTNYGTTNGA